MQTNPTLPPEVSQALTSIGLKLAAREPIGPEIQQAVGLLQGLDARDLARAEREIVESAALYRLRREPGAKNKLFTRWVSDTDQLNSVEGLQYLFLFHRDGRLREAALRKIAGPLPGPFLFAAVAWRLNDWAVPVRIAAAECAARAFPFTRASTIAEAATVLLTRQTTWGRWNVERQVLDAVFQRHDVVACLAEIIGTRLTGAMASLLRQLLRSSSIDEHLQRLSVEAVQPAVRAAAMQTLIKGNAEWPEGWRWRWIDKSMGIRRRETAFAARPLTIQGDPESSIRRGLADCAAVVRSAAMAGLIQEQAAMPDASMLALNMRNDRSRAVRDRAEFVIKRSDETNA